MASRAAHLVATRRAAVERLKFGEARSDADIATQLGLPESLVRRDVAAIANDLGIERRTFLPQPANLVWLELQGSYEARVQALWDQYHAAVPHAPSPVKRAGAIGLAGHHTADHIALSRERRA